MAHWFFFEPVNFDETVYDSDALPAIRGASIALLKAPAAFVAKLDPAPTRQVHFSSSVLGETDMEPADIERAFFKFQENPGTGDRRLDEALKSMSFSFGTAPCLEQDGGFATEMIAARNACQRNRFRLNSARMPSEARRKLGENKERADHYRALGVDLDNGCPKLPESFEDLVKFPPGDFPEKFRNKMAVLEFDADRLGEKLDTTSFEAFKTASDGQNTLMLGLIRALFEELTAEDRLEMEILLLAGDEGIVIFPVWHLQKVMHIVAEHLLDRNVLTTFSSGLVICGRKTPILTVRRMTRELIGANKSITSGLPEDERQSLLQYVVVGDMDIPGGSVEKYRERLLGFQPSEQGQVFPIKLAGFDAVLQNLRRVKTRGPNGAPASHSKVKAAIARANLIRAASEANSSTCQLKLLRADLSASDKAADKVAARVIASLAGGSENATNVSGIYDFATLLHASALMPFLTHVEDEEESGEPPKEMQKEDSDG